MAPYDPPNTHYAHLDVSSYDRNMILCMIGKGGQGFYKLTDWLKLDYLWYDSEENRIELWGSESVLMNGAKDNLIKSITKFENKFLKNKSDKNSD